MNDTAYEIAILGDVSDVDRDRLRESLRSLIEDFELEFDFDVGVRTAAELGERNIKAASAAAYFLESRHH